MSLGHEPGFVLIGLAGPMDVVNLSLSLSVRPRQHDRFVLIGLCWLYGHSEFQYLFHRAHVYIQTSDSCRVLMGMCKCHRMQNLNWLPMPDLTVCIPSLQESLRRVTKFLGDEPADLDKSTGKWAENK